MGFNLTGMAISKNYSNNIEELAKEFGWKLDKVGEVTFETASANWTKDDDCFAYFTEKGTLLFLGSAEIDRKLSTKNDTSLSFALCEGPMLFVIYLTEQGKLRRHLVLENTPTINIGEPLEVDIDPEYPNEGAQIIYDLISKLIGKRFYEIEWDEKAIHFKLSKIK